MTNQMLALLELRAVNANCSDVCFSRPPPPTTVSPDTRPLGTYETRMAARTVKRSVLTILRKKQGTVNSQAKFRYERKNEMDCGCGSVCHRTNILSLLYRANILVLKPRKR